MHKIKLFFILIIFNDFFGKITLNKNFLGGTTLGLILGGFLVKYFEKKIEPIDNSIKNRKLKKVDKTISFNNDFKKEKKEECSQTEENDKKYGEKIANEYIKNLNKISLEKTENIKLKEEIIKLKEELEKEKNKKFSNGFSSEEKEKKEIQINTDLKDLKENSSQTEKNYEEIIKVQEEQIVNLTEKISKIDNKIAENEIIIEERFKFEKKLFDNMKKKISSVINKIESFEKLNEDLNSNLNINKSPIRSKLNLIENKSKKRSENKKEKEFLSKLKEIINNFEIIKKKESNFTENDFLLLENSINNIFENFYLKIE